MSVESIYVYGDAQLPGQRIDHKNFQHYLGTQSSVFVYADNAINPNVFSALSGTVKRGGIVFLCWTTLPDCRSSIYCQRFYRELQESEALLSITQGEPDEVNIQQLTALQSHYQCSKIPLVSANEFLYGAITQDQSLAVSAILKVALGRRNKPLVITADRGRGKTTALALACIELSRSKNRHFNILLTAPKKEAVNGLFETIKAALAGAIIDKNTLTYQNLHIEFCPIDIMLLKKKPADLLLVDEAAGFPLYLLKQLFSVYHRTVFSSTLHGYEGAGRGFALKFYDIIEDFGLTHADIYLNQPIRWAENDPLETFVFSACLLNAQLHDIPSDIIDEQFTPQNLRYQDYSAAYLLANEALLARVFSILVTAHYQTSPNDLLLLLDNENLKLRVLLHKNGDQMHIVAVAIIMQEGDIDELTQAQVREGKRRIKDHFLPQSFLAHCGATNAFDFSYWRIMRIAVHPNLQNKGIGQHFIGCIEQEAQHKHVDIIGTSFALNRPLLNFWHQQGWQIARVGFTQDKASGEHSALLIKGLSETTHAFTSDAIVEFYRAFPFLLSDQFCHVPSSLVLDILAKRPQTSCAIPSKFDIQSVRDFVGGNRQFDPCAYSLSNVLLTTLSHTTKDRNENTEAFCILIARLLQKHSLAKVCSDYIFSGKKELNLFLREAAGKLLN